MSTDPTLTILMYFVLPVWLAAGFADWLCHRATHIESTTGAKESVIHLLMFAEVGVPLLAAIFFEINAGIILLMIVAFLAHEATALWDVSYAVGGRKVTPFEQHVHSFLELVPLMAIVLVVSRHWPQFQALLGLGGEPARFELVAKNQPLPVAYIVTLFALILVFELLPYLEELWRGLRMRRRDYASASASGRSSP
ncbi:diguanylate cyclase [Paraburkholderia phenoliruptrix]|uniref:diguanylate cyclase n=1 Tax=Paraburkholderia phenoliruptrix TaxID=252970 RepID=UPI001C6DDEDA|nr:diguanylate cyclase [Paraburkholderia phenoliruptrix]MBW9103008.1 diguanylate cyclase [Paraburkholderia phenoliruptrix]MBW9127813.1 diguanylate cyclase [Paraburkholderia ginsengiterrae]